MTAHADICSKLNNLSLICDYVSTSQALTEAAALIQQMASELAKFAPIDGNRDNTSLENWFPISAEQLKAAESELADLRAKIAAAGLPDYPVVHTLRADYESEWIQKKDYDTLRGLAIAQAARIAEVDSETRLLFEALKKIAAFGEDAGGALRYDKNCFLLLNIANAALQLAAKHD